MVQKASGVDQGYARPHGPKAPLAHGEGPLETPREVEIVHGNIILG